MFSKHFPQTVMRHIFVISRCGCCGMVTPDNRNSNYYECLEIPQTSTQSDIKAAYYKLSMQYHPDKNQGSDLASKKFRQISQAYEVLGNYRLRRLYDKGIIHTAESQFAQRTQSSNIPSEKNEDDPQTKFYKSRFKMSKVMDATGRTPIYNFDEWSRAHYGKSFQRRQESKTKWARQQDQKFYNITSTQNEITIFTIIFIIMGMYVIFYTDKESYDTPKPLPVNTADEESR